MGVYYRKFRKTGRRIWWLNYMVGGRQVFESSHSTSKRFAERLLAIRKAEVLEGRHNLLKTHCPKLGEWSEKYLEAVQHANTRRRYACSRVALISFFGAETPVNHIGSARIDEFIRARRNEKVKAATINRDLRFLAQLLKQAERERYIARTPFDLGKFFQTERDRRKPHILTWEEQEKLLAMASPRIRVLTVLGVETGMRTGEMLGLRWQDIDFLNDALQVVKSKTAAGIRSVPMSAICKSELLIWRSLIGPAHSEWVFPSLANRRHKLQGGRKAWASTLKKARIPFFPIYYLRHTFASRLTSAGVSPLTIAHMLGHSSTQVVARYAQVMDQNRVDAMKKLQSLREAAVSGECAAQPAYSETIATADHVPPF